MRAALPFAAGQATVPAVSPQVAALARGALQMMMWSKIKVAMVVMCLLGLTGVGAGWLTRGRAGTESAAAGDPAPQPPKQVNKADPGHAEAAWIERLRKDIEHLDEEYEKLEGQLLQYGTGRGSSSFEVELRRAERQHAFERERERARLKLLDDRLLIWEKKIIEAEASDSSDRLKRLRE
jgi:hypothetical protein